MKPLMLKYTAITVMAWCFLLGLVMVLPFGASEFGDVDWSTLSTPVIAAMAFVVVMVTFVAYLLNTWALGVVSPSVVGIYVYMQPVLAAVVTWFFMRIGSERLGLPGQYDATIGWQQGLCAALIFIGVHLVSRADRVR
ncbi:MAG TPA: DMT family transporter [Flavobacteriales bacterium]|nr:DMT family transporter [Flavobacteriales bacterium]